MASSLQGAHATFYDGSDASSTMVGKQIDGVTSPVHKFVEPKPVVVCIQWCPDMSSVLGSLAEDDGMNIRDYEMMNKYYNLNLDVFWCWKIVGKFM
uniref:Uncharacterized protein n=1 Tax=Tanacetum cinerariifolium TaxID=118510 RepID=A0A699I5H2_TANCI|nr:hypothetical protein [Tanacetum cinerariifolium]